MTELLFEHVVGGRHERSEVAALLRLRIQDALHAATGEDWQGIAEAYAADDGDLDPAALGETGGGRVHEFDGSRFDVGLVREFLAMLLVDPASADRVAEAVERAGYGEASPIPEAGEFQVGDYGAGGSPGQAGEFKVTLIELANGGRWGLYPHLEVFGDGEAALREAIDAGILDVLGPAASREEFARRLTAIGIV